jgi:quinol monooxygenase YgiN
VKVQRGSLVVFSLHIAAPAEKRWALVRSLGALLAPTRVEPGCLEARLYADLDDPNVVMLVEEWESRDEFQLQLCGDKLKSLIAAIELSSVTPFIRVDLVDREEGFECLDNLQSPFLGADR